MTLKMEIENLDGLDESISKLYVEKDGKFYLDVTGHEKSEGDRIPRSRLNQEIEKRKLSEQTLKEFADTLIEDIPEEKRSIIPDLAPAQKIRWLREALKLGFFDEKQTTTIDSKRPSDKKPQNFENMSPQAIMATGYNK
jgi:hypothetical protein